MYQLTILNSQAMPNLEIVTLSQYLSQNLKHVSIKFPISNIEVSEAIALSDSQSNLFLILNNKKKNTQISCLAQRLANQKRKFLIFYCSLQNFENNTVNTYEKLISTIKIQLLGIKRPSFSTNIRQSQKIALVSISSKNKYFRDIVQQLFKLLSQNSGIQYNLNVNLQQLNQAHHCSSTILVFNQEDLYQHTLQFKKICKDWQKKNCKIIVYSQKGEIPYGFRFDQLATNPTQLQSKIQWTINQNRLSSFEDQSNTDFFTKNYQQPLSNFVPNSSDIHHKRLLTNQEKVSSIIQEEQLKERKDSLRSQMRRASRRQRTLKLEPSNGVFEWVCKKKPSGYYVTLPEEQYRKHGIKKTFYGVEGIMMTQRRRSSLMKKANFVDKRNSVDKGNYISNRRHSKLLKQELSNLQQKLSKSPPIITNIQNSNKSLGKTNRFASQVYQDNSNTSKIESLVQPRRQSTVGYNQINFQQLRAFHESLPLQDSIPSSMSFGSLQSNPNMLKRPSIQSAQFQNQYYNGSLTDYTKSKTQSAEFQSTQTQNQFLSAHSKYKPQMTQKVKVAKSPQTPRHGHRLSTIRDMLQLPIIYYPQSQHQAQYLISKTYCNRFILMSYKSTEELKGLLQKYVSSTNVVFVFNQYFANEARKFLNFQKQNFKRGILYSARKNISLKAFPGINMALGDNNLLSEINKLLK